MKRKTSTLPTRVYSYGAVEPIENLELVNEQFKKARLYHNTLIQIEIERRAGYREITGRHGDAPAVIAEIVELKAALELARQSIQQAKVIQRTKNPEAVEAKAKVAIVIAALKKKNARLKEIRAALKTDESVIAELKKLEDDTKVKIKTARAASGLYWGTYLLVEKSAEAIRKGNDPKFRKWDGSGRLGVQIQRSEGLGEDGMDVLGMPVSRLFGGVDTRISMASVPDATWDRSTTTRGNRIRATRRIPFRMRIGSDESKKPIWTTIPIFYHRPIPKDAVIKNVWLHRYRFGKKMAFKLQFTIEAASFIAKPASPLKPAAAIDIGWRSKNDGGLRIGYLFDQTGYSREIALTEKSRDYLGRQDGLRAVRDKNFNEIKPKLIQFLSHTAVPEWLSEQLMFLPQWRSSQKLAAVIFKWDKQRFPEDVPIYDEMKAWRKQEMHLYDWEYNERAQALGWRREFARITAKKIAGQYSAIYIEDFDLREVAKAPMPEESTTVSRERSRGNRHKASLSEWRQCLLLACANAGVPVVKVDPANTTLTCYRCGFVGDWDPAPKIKHTCAGCGVTWDQDYNAAQNILARGLAVRSPEQALPHANGHTASDHVKAPSASSLESQVSL